MSINIEKKGRRIEIRSGEPLPGMKTTIPGAYLNVSGVWTVPLSIESCKLLRQKFGRRLVVGNELRRWAKAVVDSRRYMAKLASAKDAKLEHLAERAPKLARAMRKRRYQRVGVRFAADNGSASGIFDEPGLGKTLIALGAILEAGIPGPYLIIAPKTASDSVWRREITRWLPSNHRAVTVPEMRLQRERKLRLTRFGPNTWLVVHPEMVMVQAWWICQEVVTKRKRQRNKRTGKRRVREYTEPCGVRTAEGGRNQRVLKCGHVKGRKTTKVLQHAYPALFEREWGAIINDECHENLIRRTGTPTQRRRGMDLLRVRPDGMKLALSGTPFDSKPHQLWGTLNWLDPVQYSAFGRWAELYWQKGGYTGYQIGEFRKDREPMLWDSLSAIALRRTKEEVAADLPPKLYVGTPLTLDEPDSPVGIWLEVGGKQAKAYEEMERLSMTQLDSGRLDAVSALAEMTRLKQLACSYGDMHSRFVMVPCMKSQFPHAPCEYVRHKEERFFYVPQLPSNKFTWTVDSLEEWGYPHDPITKVVIVSFYTGILELFQQGLEKHFKTKPRKPLCTAITGRTPNKDRRRIIDRFNESDNEHVMLLNVKAGGTAITIDSADRMIFISETRIPDQQRQAEDRIHRVSNPRQCMYYYLRSLGTIDVGTAVVNQEAILDTHRLLDERRGVAYMRQVLDLSHR